MLSSLNESIRKLNIIIDFIISSEHSDKDETIVDYAVKVLNMTKMEDDEFDKKVSDHNLKRLDIIAMQIMCVLNFLFKISGLETKYLQSLWNLLSLRHVLLLTEHGYDPFDKLSDSYRDIPKLEELGISSENINTGIDKLIIKRIRQDKKYLNISNLYNLLDFLYKFIVYKLIPASEMQKEEEDMEFPPHLCILDFLTPGAVEDIDNHFDLEFNECNLNNILLKHIYQLWKYLVKIYNDIS